jgi:hypothetical protein
MLIKSTFPAVVAAVCLLFPTLTHAGGPPRLIIPIDGVTPESVKECADLFSAKLTDKLWRFDRSVELQRHSEQWYLTFSMGDDVDLGGVVEALQGSPFSIPREELRFFGPVCLKLDADAAVRKDLLSDLEELKYVSVASSEDQKDCLEVTLDMPYPYVKNGRVRESVGWDEFRRNDFSFDQSTRSEPPATAGMLPSFKDIHDVLAKHNATLTEIHWSQNYACRQLGCVTAPVQAP